MSARDDYPIGRSGGKVIYTIDPGQWQDMCDEIDQLRAEREAVEVIRRTIHCPDCQGAEWMIEPEGDDPGCHCGGCTDGYISHARAWAIVAAVHEALQGVESGDLGSRSAMNVIARTVRQADYLRRRMKS